MSSLDDEKSSSSTTPSTSKHAMSIALTSPTTSANYDASTINTSRIITTGSGSQLVTARTAAPRTTIRTPADAPKPTEVEVSVVLHTLRTQYTAKSNHFLQTDPIVVIGVDQRPLLKTRQLNNTTTCAWNLARASERQTVHDGLNLAQLEDGVPPQFTVSVAALTTGSCRLHIQQEDYAAVKTEDDMGGFSMKMEEILARAWKVGTQQVDASSKPQSPDTNGSNNGKSSSDDERKQSDALTPHGCWYPIRITGSPLLDRSTGRQLGEIDLELSIRVDTYLRYLVASHTNLHLLWELTSAFLAHPSTSTPLRHIICDAASWTSFIRFIVEAGQDQTSIDGERMREKVWELIKKVLEVFTEQREIILNTFFANSSSLWSHLFTLRHCISPTSFASPHSFHTYQSLCLDYISLLTHVGVLLEPPPAPPVKSAAELAEATATEAMAVKKQALKEKRRRAVAAAAAKAGEEMEDEEEEDGDGAHTSRTSSRHQKRKSQNGLAVALSTSLIDPLTYAPSALHFGVSTYELINEAFAALRIHMCGGVKRVQEPSSSSSSSASAAASASASASIEWTNEQKVMEYIQGLEWCYQIHAFVIRYGSWNTNNASDGDATTQNGDDAAEELSSSTSSSQPSPSSHSTPLPTRLGIADLRSLFLPPSSSSLSSVDAIWFQKQLQIAVKRARETLSENREAQQRLTMQVEYWNKCYPVVKVEKEKKSTHK